MSNSNSNPTSKLNGAEPTRKDFSFEPSLSDIMRAGRVAIKHGGIIDQKGLGGACDMGIGYQPLTNQPQTYIEQIQASERLYYGDWQSNKIVDRPVYDAYRKGWKYEGLEADEVDLVDDLMTEMHILETFKQASRLERLHGGSAIYLGLADYAQDTSMPVDFRSIASGDLKFVNLIKRHEISKVTIQYDPLQPDFGYPSHYWIRGQQIHKDRLIFFRGNPLAPVASFTYQSAINYRNDGFGYPILMTLYSDLLNATKSRQIASHLMERASSFIVSTDVQTLEATHQGTQNLSALQNMMNQLNNYNAAIVSNAAGQKTDISTISANFGAVPELIESYKMTLASGSNIPRSIFLGESIGGMNSKGQGELENYYTFIQAYQENQIRPTLMYLFKFILPTLDLDVDDEFGIIFNPLWDDNDQDKANTRQTNVQNMIGLIQTGMLTEEEAVEELKAHETFLTEIKDVPRGTPAGFGQTDGANIDNTLSNQLSSLKELT